MVLGELEKGGALDMDVLAIITKDPFRGKREMMRFLPSPEAGQSGFSPLHWAEMKIYLDGKYVDEADAKVSVFDHGLLTATAFLRESACYGGNVFRLEEHLERLEYSAKAIMLDIAEHLRQELSDIVCETCRQNSLIDAYIRLVVTRGVGDLGLAPWLCAKPSRCLSSPARSPYTLKSHYENGLAIVDGTDPSH